jgi:hypothetical protein
MGRRPIMVAAVAALVFACLSPAAPPPLAAASTAGAPTAAPQQPAARTWPTPVRPSKGLVPQIDGKTHRNPKADSQVAAVIEAYTSQGATAAIAQANSGSLTVAGSAIRVIIEATDVAQASASATAAGAKVEETAGKLVQILATPAQLSGLQDAAGVSYLRAPMAHAEDVVVTPIAGEGVVSTNASGFQATGQTGAGVKVAIIDLGFVGLAAAQANGDIPASVTTVDDCEGGFNLVTTHGTAVTEIVHEMAPDAVLTLICINTDVDLANAETYAKANGIQIINHSVAWFNTSRGDGSGSAGTPDAIAADANANGILWVNAAGNYAQEHWSGNFVDDGYGWNMFTPTADYDQFFLPANDTMCAYLKWDAWPTTDQDFDLAVYRSSDGAFEKSSVTVQNGSQRPTEYLCYTNNTGADDAFFAAIHKTSATTNPRFDLFLHGMGFQMPVQFVVAGGSLAEPASAPSVFAAGAVCWAGVTAEPFSSQGPTIDGRIKPDIAGPDYVSSFTYGNFTSCTGASGFAGTSAASPHVAGAAALVLGANPTYTPAQIKAYLQTNSTDLGSVGTDNTYGSGLLMLPTKPSPPANVAGFPYDSSVQVFWSAPHASGRPIQLYTVTSDPASAGCTSTVTTCTVPGLTNGTPYTFQVTATNVLGTSEPSAASDPVTPAAPIPATYHPVPPARVLDTRYGTGLSGAFSSHVARSFQVTGNGGVPNGATAVTGNLTVTQQTSVGFLFIGPVGMSDPTSSNLNFPVGDDRANAVTVALNQLGKLSITFAAPTYGPTAHVIFDVTG